jgi:nickel transport protein
MHNRHLILAAVAVAVAVLAPSRASAHDLQAVVKLLPDVVRVEAGFDDDTPAEGAKVTITDAAGNVVAEGKTDDRGVCDLPKLAPGKYTAKVESIGHADTVDFEVSDEGGEFAGWRLNKSVGVGIGAGGLLGASAGFWLLRRRRGG